MLERALIFLEHIILSTNHIGGTIPTVYGQLSELKEFQMTNCNLEGPVPSELGLLSNLGKEVLPFLKEQRKK